MARGTLGKPIWGIVLVGLAATGCTTATTTKAPLTTQSNKPTKVTYNYTAKDRDCLKRAMYFESEHSDPDGYMAVGTVVMNRLTSGAYPDTICGIVSQEKQFAPGVMTREVKSEAEPALNEAADAVLHGKRHPGVKDAMFFHTQGLRFPYNNMHYVVVAGGNAFYEKRDPVNGMLQTPAPLPPFEVAMNYVAPGIPGRVQPTSFDNQRFVEPTEAAPRGQAIAAIDQNLNDLPGVSPVSTSAPSQSAAFAASPVSPGVDRTVPAAVPVPTPMPAAADETPATIQPYALPVDVALPTPRPMETSAMRGAYKPIGG